MKTFLLITNTSGCTYWSYLGYKGNAPEYRREIEDYGVVFINRNGGYFTSDCIRRIHAAVVQDDFPPETEKTFNTKLK